MFPFANISNTYLRTVHPRFQYAQRRKQPKPEAAHFVVYTVQIKNRVFPQVRNFPKEVSPVWDEKYRN
jgi:hypothetical protein